ELPPGSTLFPYTTLSDLREWPPCFRPGRSVMAEPGARKRGSILKKNSPIYSWSSVRIFPIATPVKRAALSNKRPSIHSVATDDRSEEHTSELQSRENRVC